MCGISQFVLLVFCPISHNVGALERFSELCLNTTYGNAFLSKYQWGVTDSKPKLNTNVSCQLFRRLIFSISCAVGKRIFLILPVCDDLEISWEVWAQIKYAEHSSNCVCFLKLYPNYTFNYRSWRQLYSFCVSVCVSLKSLVMTLFTAAVHVLPLTHSSAVPNRPRTPLVGWRAGSRHVGWWVEDGFTKASWSWSMTQPKHAFLN